MHDESATTPANDTASIFCRHVFVCMPGRPLLPPPRVGLQKCQQWVGMILLSYLPTLHWQLYSTLCVRHARPWLRSAKKNWEVILTTDYNMDVKIVFLKLYYRNQKFDFFDYRFCCSTYQTLNAVSVKGWASCAYRITEMLKDNSFPCFIGEGVTKICRDSRDGPWEGGRLRGVGPRGNHCNNGLCNKLPTMAEHLHSRNTPTGSCCPRPHKLFLNCEDFDINR